MLAASQGVTWTLSHLRKRERKGDRERNALACRGRHQAKALAPELVTEIQCDFIRRRCIQIGREGIICLTAEEQLDLREVGAAGVQVLLRRGGQQAARAQVGVRRPNRLVGARQILLATS